MDIFQQEMSLLWKNFVEGGQEPAGRIRPEIRQSWERCLGRVDPGQRPAACRPAEEGADGVEEGSELLQVSSPIMDSLDRFVRSSRFVIALADGDGKLLKLTGDPDYLIELQEAHFLPGADWKEAVMGTNAVGTCLLLEKPLQVFGFEHWNAHLQGLFASAAPIFDPDSGRVQGVLAMVAAECLEDHTLVLGLAACAAASIQAKMAAERTNSRLRPIDLYRDSILDSLVEGLMTIDLSGRITFMNQRAMDFLQIEENPAGQNILPLLRKRFADPAAFRRMADILTHPDQSGGELMAATTAFGLVHYTVQARCVYENGQVIGKAIVLQEKSVPPSIPPRGGNSARFSFSDLIGRNRHFLEGVEMAIQAAHTHSNVMLTGESGTGKELFAQAIHNLSPRAGGPFIALNCASIPRELLGSEIFGYTEGAFTGARRGGNPGKFELAHQGTIFLDEIGDMPQDMQVCLLRVLEEKRVMRLGGRETIPVDVRIIAATNRDLNREVEAGRFRSDLFYRLNVMAIELPPLREREEDIPLLVEHFARKLAGTLGREVRRIDPEFMDVCVQHRWPGNVRELQNVLETAISLSADGVLSRRSLPASYRPGASPSDSDKPMGLKPSLKEISLNSERDLILSLLAKYKGNKSLAARELGIARSSLYRKMAH